MKKTKRAKENKKLKVIGLSILIIPILFLLLFLVGETLGGDISGLSHLLQIIPFVIIELLSSKFPYVMGIILTFIGVTLLVFYSILASISYPIVLLILFLILIISGVLLISSQR